MSGSVIHPGDVVKLRFPHSSPPKLKYCLCVCIEAGFFLTINTERYRAAPADSQLILFQSELSCLEYDSVLDISKHYFFDDAVIRESLCRGVYSLAESARERIKYNVNRQRYLPREVKALILKNL